MSDTRWVVDHFDKVRETGKDSWVACCPAHDDKSPSLSIRDTSDKILIHCFAGCDINTILGNVGLEVADIFHTQRIRRLPDIELERLVVEIGDCDLKAGRRLSDEDKERYRQAVRRLACR